MIAQLRLENFVVDKLTFNTALGNDKASKGLIDVDFQVKAHAEDNNKYLLMMQVDLNKGKAFKKSGGYQIHMQILGWFKFTDELNEDAKTRMLFANAASILFGVARTIVAQLTGTLGQSRFILPSVNLLEIAKRRAATLKDKQQVRG